MNERNKRFRCGLISASLWVESRTVEERTVEHHSISITKSYKDGDAWKKSKSFSTEDLPKIAMVASEAYKYIRLKTSEPYESSIDKDS